MFDPLHLAADAAVVDLLSAGRLILGLGLGWRDEEFEGWAVSRRERATRLEGTVAVLRQAWSDELVTGDGRHFSYPGLNVTPKPATIGGPPIWIGAGAERAVRRAARIADGYFGSGASVQAMAERVSWIRDEAEATGRDLATFSFGLQRMTFAWRDGDAWERVRDAAHYMNWKYEDMGRARGSRERRRPPTLSAEAEAALRRRVIVGSPGEVADEIRAYEAIIGTDGTFGMRSYFPGLDPAVQQESFDILGEEVLPLLR
jgi:alkanesulfonate monooxygenase SsuD/methylene tetrahydromethanopterin reductase-like flavin-dependent oxidoreductase (luciferase family)